MVKALKIEAKDNVAVLLGPAGKGDILEIDGFSLPVNEEIPFGHKVALTDIHAGGRVIKYGEVIGCATSEIKAGDWVHDHNVTSDRGRLKGGGYPG